jgi:uncharacterized protein YgbK (DUF1537 family)
VTERLLLIADDLTGALDAAVQFSRAGVPAFAAMRDVKAALDADAAAVAADIESRHLPPAEAADRVTRCVESAMSAGVRRFYKKTDSTLRGNVGAELAALLHAAGCQELHFVPALPDAGRITRGGVQYVDGQPLNRSRYSGDIANPVNGASVSAIIASQTDIAVARVPRGADPAAILAKAGRPVILVFDAETNNDLDVIAEQLAALGPPRLLAGCAGFASVVPRLLGMGTGAPLAPPAVPPPAPALRPPLLVVCGSMNEVSRSQVRQAQALGIPCWDAEEGDADAADSAGAAPAHGNPAGADPARTLADALRKNGAAVVTTGRSLGASCAMVRRVIQQIPVGTLAVFGGDTAIGVMDALGVRGVWPLGEICPGVVVSRPESASSDIAPAGLHLVTKAGGFGPVDLIQRIRAVLQEEK